jgi:two-component system, OmpR family, phosphate regulon sensor histidine kinase PhoR
MARFRAPAVVLLRRAQLMLMLAALIPTVLMTAIGIVMLSIGGGLDNIVLGLLLLAFCTTAITGYILGSIFVSRGASQARFQNDFLSSVSHELRTPLTSISMFIEALRDKRLTDPQEHESCLELLAREVQRLGALVEQLLDLTRMESGQVTLRREAVMVSDIIEDALVSFNAASLTERMPVDIEHDEPDVALVGDRETLARAVSNLLVNAWKYSDPDDRRIRLVVEAHDRHVDIAVIDNGHGIPRQEQRQVFERFARGRRAIDGEQTGSGLGLAMVRAIIRAHRGKIELRSRVGEGSEFRIRLRRAREVKA